MKDHMGGIFLLPRPIRRDLLLLFAGKVCILAVLYWLFFSPSHRPTIDMLTHIAGPLAGR